MEETELRNDLFIIPINNKYYMIYAPLRKGLFLVNYDAKQKIEEYMSGNLKLTENNTNDKLIKHLQTLEQIKPYQPIRLESNKHKFNRVTILLTHKCNFACSYCYSQSERSSKVLDKNKIIKVVDYVFSVSTQKRPPVFSFLGGGEPTTCWQTLVFTVSYIKDKSKETGLIPRLGLTTNGSLLTSKKINWLKSNKFNVNVSYDILPQVQNNQRPFASKLKGSFETVDKNIKLLIANRCKVSIRATITSISLNKMQEMVKFVKDNYPTIKRLHFEPLTDYKNTTSNDFFRDFVENFDKAYNYGIDNDIELYCSLSTSKIRRRFCYGEFCITPDATITACHREASENDMSYDNFVYGKITDKEVIIDKNKLYNITNTHSFEQNKNCISCFARWHCAGGCPSAKLYDMNYIGAEEKRCDFTRMFLKKVLEKRLFNFLKENKLSV